MEIWQISEVEISTQKSPRDDRSIPACHSRLFVFGDDRSAMPTHIPNHRNKKTRGSQTKVWASHGSHDSHQTQLQSCWKTGRSVAGNSLLITSLLAYLCASNELMLLEFDALASLPHAATEIAELTATFAPIKERLDHDQTRREMSKHTSCGSILDEIPPWLNKHGIVSNPRLLQEPTWIAKPSPADTPQEVAWPCSAYK